MSGTGEVSGTVARATFCSLEEENHIQNHRCPMFFDHVFSDMFDMFLVAREKRNGKDLIGGKAGFRKRSR